MKKYFYISLVAIAAMLASCGKEEVVIESISMEKSIVVRVDSTYTLNVRLTPESQKAVINWQSSNEEVARVSDGVVTGIEKGTAIITANVGNTIATCEVAVKDPIASITLKLMACTEDSAAVLLTPSIKDSYYSLGFTTKEYIEKFTAQEIIESTMKNLQQVASSNGVDIEYVLNYYGYQGEKTWTINKLDASTDYVMYAFAINPEDGEASEELYTIDVRTKDITKSDMTFDFAIEGSVVTITPSANIPYALQVMPDTTFQKTYESNAEEYMNSAKEFYNKNYSAYGGFYAILHTGVYTYDYKRSFKDGVTYTAILVGYKGGWCTDFFTKTFTYTAPVEPEEPTEEPTEEAPATVDPMKMVQVVPQAGEIVKG